MFALAMALSETLSAIASSVAALIVDGAGGARLATGRSWLSRQDET
jgi:hypothetical protein